MFADQGRSAAQRPAVHPALLEFAAGEFLPLIPQMHC